MATVQALAVLMSGLGAGPYEPTWESLDKRPNPQWFEDAKFGIFIHWGVYSVPAWGPKGKYAEWYWHDMQDKEGETWKHHVATYGEDFRYQDFAPMFKAELYNVFNNQSLVLANTAVTPDPNSPLDANGLRTGYIKPAAFGTARGVGDYPRATTSPAGTALYARTFLMSFGLRF